MKTIAAASLMLSLACAHAREAEDPTSAQAAPEEQPESSDQASEEAPGAKEPAQKEGRVSGGAEDPSEIPVASSPKGLLQPGAEQKVRDKLGVKGGAPLREALKKFQKEHDLPATGILDQRTVESLGLDPDDVFERASGT